MSTNQNQIENQKNQLSAETWKNEPTAQPLTEQLLPFIEQFIEDASSGKGFADDLSFEAGDTIELTFKMDHPNTGMRTKDMPAWENGQMVKNEDGKIIKVGQTKPNFYVYNHRDKVEQNWWISSKWAVLAAETMKKYQTDTLEVTRTGKKKDTIYTFMPTMLKRAM